MTGNLHGFSPKKNNLCCLWVFKLASEGVVGIIPDRCVSMYVSKTYTPIQILIFMRGLSYTSSGIALNLSTCSPVSQVSMFFFPCSWCARQIGSSPITNCTWLKTLNWNIWYLYFVIVSCSQKDVVLFHQNKRLLWVLVPEGINTTQRRKRKVESAKTTWSV